MVLKGFCFNSFLGLSAGSLHWPCGCVLESSTPCCTVKWKQSRWWNCENKPKVEKSKNYPLKRRVCMCRERVWLLYILLDLYFLRGVTYSYTTSVFAQTFILWHFSPQAFPLQYSALLFNGILFHGITAACTSDHNLCKLHKPACTFHAFHMCLLI